jgi:hypothetical protein
VDFQVRISEPALTDFEDILEYSWIKFPATAEAFGHALQNHIALLQTFPFLTLATLVVGGLGVRQLVHTPILIDCRVQEKSQRRRDCAPVARFQ